MQFTNYKKTMSSVTYNYKTKTAKPTITQEQFSDSVLTVNVEDKKCKMQTGG